ncbi:MAG: glycosyltransferase family 4 protein [Verrucomicrobia bacterium]|jgi:alpha-maltose-1-phosphate synthase|nr:glycosyltransferase family 4 protein [Verrucomicrobiota bacterium]MBT7067831.1 glycosyltransferase family 4 protein [Verrucomicrobiota bacterium]MBT7700289.1 glycosyltransferase family 4 protein [Verrucomicrobiota bacterium]
MRVAILSLHVGAMAHYASSLAHALRPRHEVACFLPRGVSDEHLSSASRSFTYGVPQWATLGELLRYLAAPMLVHRIVRDIHHWQPDIIHVNSGHILYGLFLGALARRYPMVSTIHDIDPHLGEPRPFDRMKLAPLLKHSRIITVHSEKLRELALAKWHLAPARVCVTPMAFHDVFEPWRTGIAEEPNTLLLYGRLREYKGIRTILEAMPDILEHQPDAKLILAGQGDLTPYAAPIAQLGDRIEVINRFVSDAESAALFERCSIALAPYLEASQSSIPFVAASFSKPIIASRIGAIPEVVQHEQTGLLVPPGDTSALAEAVTRLLDDADLKQRLGHTASRNMHEQFGPTVVRDRLETVYRRAMSRTERGRHRQAHPQTPSRTPEPAGTCKRPC